MTASTAPTLARVLSAFESLPHCRLIGMRITALGEGRGEAALPYSDDLVGNPKSGVVHGGVITTLLDTLCGLVVMASVPDGTALATLDLRIDYLKPATPSEEIRGSAECYRVTPNVAFVRGHAYQHDVDDPIAHCTGTFALGATGFRTAEAVPASSGGQPC